ncbi:MAG: S9 family peptidase [Anaerolineae bacterium]|nr:S9 family peptidase [Anaerolineae bacterium]
MTTHQPPSPPIAPRHSHEIVTHGHKRVDDYYWLREKENEDVIAYLEAENSYTAAMLKEAEGLQKTLYEEMVGRIQETDQTVPVRIDDYYYYSRTEEGKQYPIYCRKHGSVEAPEEIMLDLNRLAEGHDYLRMGIFRVSPDHRLLAYSIDTSGAEQYTVFFKRVEDGTLLRDQIENTSYSAEWAADSSTFFYTTKDAAMRDFQVWRHRLDADAEPDEVVYEDLDERFWVNLYKTKDRRYLFVTSESKETSEQHFLETSLPYGSFTLLQPRVTGLRYYAEHRHDTFFIVTNDEAKNFRIVTAPTATPGRSHWQEFLPHRETVKVDDIDLFSRHLAVYEREKGLRTMRIVKFDSGEYHYVDFPEPVYTYSQESNPEFDSHLLRFTYTSLTTPNSVFDYNMETGERELLKQQPVLGRFDPADYASERVFATADDGTEIPISLVYRKDRFHGEPVPCLLYGYGSYGISIDPGFDSNRLSLLDRGWIYAIAHIRGGQEMGRWWYEQGKYMHKQNTFTDFIACARHLIDQGYTRPDLLAIFGGSAGGLLVGAVLNMAPELFHAAVAAVPFVDIVTTMLDESIPLTVTEFEEWGNPKEHEYYEYMLSYSPYDNVSVQTYPHLLVTAGLNDPRVQYWEPAKWTALLRAHKQGDNLLLLKTDMGAGHAGPSGRYDYLKERALYFAFLLHVFDQHESQ